MYNIIIRISETHVYEIENKSLESAYTDEIDYFHT